MSLFSEPVFLAMKPARHHVTVFWRHHWACQITRVCCKAIRCCSAAEQPSLGWSVFVLVGRTAKSKWPCVNRVYKWIVPEMSFMFLLCWRTLKERKRQRKLAHLQEVTGVLTFLDERIQKTEWTDINRDLYAFLRERYRMNLLPGYLKDMMEILGSPL